MTSRIRRPSVLALLLAAWGGATPGWTQCAPAEIAVLADRDNTLYEAQGQDLSNGAGEFLFAGSTQTFGRRRAVLRFDVAGAVPPLTTLTSARLLLEVSKSSGVAVGVYLHRVAADWGEGTSDAGDPGGGGVAATPNDATWAHRFFPATFWTSPGGDFAALPSALAFVSGIGPYIWGSTPAMVADAQGWLDAPATNFGWIVIADESVAGGAKRLDSRERTTPATAPALCLGTGAPSTFDIPALDARWLGLLALCLAVVAVGRLARG